MLGLRDLEPLADEEVRCLPLGHGRIAAMAVEHAVHLVARRDAFEDFTDGGRSVHRRLLLAWPD